MKRVLILATVLWLMPVVAAGASPMKHRNSGESAAKVKAWWTPKRMAQAVDMSEIRARHRGAAVALPGGTDVTEPGPAPATSRLRHRAANDAPSAIGRIFFRWRGMKGSCTGSVIDTPSRRVVLTAAHCLNDRGTWSNYLYFVPDYYWGDRPYGSWAWRTAWVTGPWSRSYFGQPNSDLGAIVTRVSRRGKRVGDVTGVLPYSTFSRRKGRTRIYGYPGGANRGREVRVCAGRQTWPGPRDSYRFRGPVGMAAWCNMARGSSGGPWMSAYGYEDGDTEWRIDGLTSRGFGGRLTSSYFGSHFRQLIYNAENR